MPDFVESASPVRRLMGQAYWTVRWKLYRVFDGFEKLSRVFGDSAVCTVYASMRSSGAWEIAFSSSRRPNVHVGAGQARTVGIHETLPGGWRRLFTRVQVNFPIEACLVRRRRLPNVALSHISNLLMMDLERASPLKSDDVLSGWVLRDVDLAHSEGVVVDHFVLHKRDMPPELESIIRETKVGMAIRVSDGDQTVALDSHGAMARDPIGYKILNRAISCLTGILIVVGISVIYLSFDAQSRELSRLGTELSKARQSAAASKRRSEQVESAYSKLGQPARRRTGTTTVTVLWEELSRILPADAWIEALSIDERDASLDGYATSAAELIGRLTQSSILNSVSFGAPVVRDEQRNAERFQVRFKVSEKPGGRKSE